MRRCSIKCGLKTNDIKAASPSQGIIHCIPADIIAGFKQFEKFLHFIVKGFYRQVSILSKANHPVNGTGQRTAYRIR